MLRSLILTDSRIWTAETEYAVAVARAEARLGADVTLAAPPGSAVGSILDPPFSFAELPCTQPSRSPADFLAGARWLSALLSEARFDVIHTSRATAHLMAAMVVGGRGKLVHLRGSAAPPSARAANRFLYRRLTDAVVASSSRVRRWVLERLNVPEERVLRVFAPVDAERFAPRARDETLASELGVPDTARLVVNVARLAPVKGQDVLIEAMPDVLRAHGEAVLVLVGEAWSGQLEALTHRASQLGVDGSLVFAGRREDVARFVSSASVCVSSSVGSEENSRAVAEYMASGRPIVATSVGVVPELLADNVSGVLVPPGDPEAMAGAVRGVLADDASAAAMGAEARRFALSQLSHDAFARSVSSILGSVGIDL